MKNRLFEDLKKAMKEKDTLTRDTIQLIRAEILKTEKDTQKEMTDEEIVKLIKKQRDARFDLMEQIEDSGREDIINKTFSEMNILNRYLPKQLSSKELIEEIRNTLDEIDAKSIKDLGRSIKVCKDKYEMVSVPKVLAGLVKAILEEKEKHN